MVTSPIQASVTEALYQARGKPDFDKPARFETTRMCGNCLDRKVVAPASKVLTSQFGSWDNVAQDKDGGRWLCLPCATTYRATDLRRRTSIIKQDATLERPDLAALRVVLSGPIPADTAVIVPLSGKKIIAPNARWGMLVSDTGLLRWTGRHKRLMGCAVALREMGFPESSLREDSPAFPILASLPVEQHEEVRSMWREMKPIRDDKTILPLFLFLSRKVT